MISVLSMNPFAIYNCFASHGSSMFTYGGISAQISANRLQAEGVGSFEQALHFQNQDFEALKQECLEGGYLFEDPCFPAEPPSLGFKELAPNSSKTHGVEWMRPTVRGKQFLCYPVVSYAQQDCIYLIKKYSNLL